MWYQLIRVCNNASAYVPRNSHLHYDLEIYLKEFYPCMLGSRLKDTRSESTAIKSLLYRCV